jgi:type IV secretory pathway component VirB8
MEEVLKKIAEQQEKIDAIYISVEKTRKYFMWTLIITVATVVLPLVAILVMLPFLLSSMSSLYNI